MQRYGVFKAPLCKGYARRRVSEANRRKAALRPEMSCLGLEPRLRDCAKKVAHIPITIEKS